VPIPPRGISEIWYYEARNEAQIPIAATVEEKQSVFAASLSHEIAAKLRHP
jgi:hypothetical protein